jgi:serine protease AprX
MSKTKDDAHHHVLVEMRAKRGLARDRIHALAERFEKHGFAHDRDFHPVRLRAMPHHAEALAEDRHHPTLVRGRIEPERAAELAEDPDVLRVWKDTHIVPFQARVMPGRVDRKRAAELGHDTSFGDPPNGTFRDVVQHLGVDEIWKAGHRGQGVVVAVVDSGLCAIGKKPRKGERARIPNVIGGYPKDWGTTSDPELWKNHGNMAATDVLAIAPEAKLYDIRVSGGHERRDRISRALAGYDWAIKRHRRDGTPHILTNSWGIWQRTDDIDYATDPHHPFTRKVAEAIDEGILVLFCAGNCGSTGPDARCGADKGPGRSIWGANGHPDVMTVGAANIADELTGYSSCGPAALHPAKPDFCSLTHFAGYFPAADPELDEPSDSGTSAATAIAAGVVALLKQRRPALTQHEAKEALRDTARDIRNQGFDRSSGAGVIRAKAAWDALA